MPGHLHRILAIVPENERFRKAEMVFFSSLLFPKISDIHASDFIFFLKLSFNETLRLNTRWPGAASLVIPGKSSLDA